MWRYSKDRGWEKTKESSFEGVDIEEVIPQLLVIAR